MTSILPYSFANFQYFTRRLNIAFSYLYLLLCTLSKIHRDFESYCMCLLLVLCIIDANKTAATTKRCERLTAGSRNMI